MYALEVENLTKHYRVYLRPFDRLKESIIRRSCHELVEALSDVSFEVASGDTLGIIGENGAGKSTLLKMLAGTTQQTTGTIVKHGRVAALLELGSGFHPEFSGRRNIYLNAALLGLSEREIREREDSIIDFSGLRDVIERPVKTYSSGMYVRLGFSVATSVDPDVLIIDEALSVGDQRFQKKCVDRMIEFKKDKKTIIVCSHSMYLINELCANAIWLCDGRIRSCGKTSKVITEYQLYLEKNGEDDAIVDPEKKGRSFGAEVIIEDVSVLDDRGRPLEHVEQFQSVVFRVKTRRVGPPFKGHLSVGFEQLDGVNIFETTTKISGLQPIEFVNEQITELAIPSIPVVKGRYRVKAKIGDEHAIRLIDELGSNPFVIESGRPEIGMFWIKHSWRFPEAAKGSV